MLTINLGTTATAVTTANQHIKNETTSIAVQCTLTGDPTAAVISVEGSFDGTTWATIDSHTFSAGEITAKSALFYVTGKPVPYFRLKYTTLTFTTAGTATLLIRYNEFL